MLLNTLLKSGFTVQITCTEFHGSELEFDVDPKYESLIICY